MSDGYEVMFLDRFNSQIRIMQLNSLNHPVFLVDRDLNKVEFRFDADMSYKLLHSVFIEVIKDNEE